jgi:16S rRNA (cytosine967-C5)-methyltransferase
MGQKYDGILIDAPCTGLCALRRRPEVRWRRDLKDLRALTQLQRELIASGVSALSPNGVLGYATCSPHLAETSVQVADLLRTFPHLEQIPVDPFLPGNLSDAQRSGALSLWTHKHGTDAMYLALFRPRSG